MAEGLSVHQVSALFPDLLKSNERDAKWQFAELLAKTPLEADGETFLMDLVHDSDEYVRRRALLTLAEHASHHTEQLAIEAWNSGDEYQRMACLHALYRIDSAKLPEHLLASRADGRQCLIGISERIQNRTGEYAEPK